MATPTLTPEKSQLIEMNERITSILSSRFPWWNPPIPGPGDPVDTLTKAGLDASGIRNAISIQLNTRAGITEHYAESLKLEAKASRDIASMLDKVQVKMG